MYRPIGDYGAIGNLRTIALVSRAGSIDWLCLPDLDAPSVFGAILDDARGGRFALAPVGDFEPAAAYLDGTNVLVTRFVSGEAQTELTDFMPVVPAAPEAGRTAEIFRRVRQTRGAAEIALVFDPRFDYARGETRVAWQSDRVEARGGAGRLVLAASRAFDARAGETAASWRLVAGDDLWLRLTHEPRGEVPCACEDGEAALAATAAYWRSWLGRRETGRNLDFGGFRPMVDRSALVLKLLSYANTGAIAAAATTSLPEQIGGARNWDYRYSWVRDSSFTLQALFDLGHLSETEAFLRWLERIIGGPGAAHLQIMYGLRGEEKLPEEELGHLEGYRGSRPVRIGNDAAGQRQHDIYGEVMDAALRLADYVGRIDYGLWPVLRGICEEAIARWPEPDSGIWEVRGGPRHFVHSKVMCWVALDRGLEIAERYGFPADRERWRQARDAIRAEVLEHGWSAAKGAFVQAFGSEELDASALLLPLLGFLPFDDPRVGLDGRRRGARTRGAGVPAALPLPGRARRRRGGLPALLLLVRGLPRRARASRRGRAAAAAARGGGEPPRPLRRGARPRHRRGPGQLPAGLHAHRLREQCRPARGGARPCERAAPAAAPAAAATALPAAAGAQRRRRVRRGPERPRRRTRRGAQREHERPARRLLRHGARPRGLRAHGERPRPTRTTSRWRAGCPAWTSTAWPTGGSASRSG